MLSRAYLQGRDDITPEHQKFIGDKTHELTQTMLKMDVTKIDMSDVWKDLMGCTSTMSRSTGS